MAPGVAVRPQPPTTVQSHGAVRAWLLVIALLVIAMVAVGGATRLTDSGLSITEWRPIMGTLPPLSTADWASAFEKYKQIPEYREVNHGMSLAEFKTIFWWEWGHRLLGRVIGLAFAVPMIWFWWQRRIPPGYHARLALLFALGGLQGFIGWYMVQSGLSERVGVSQYRLALHLCVAFLILAGLVWTYLDLAPQRTEIVFSSAPSGTWSLAAALTVLLFLQVALGAFVAGTKAGLIYTTWPLMEEQFIPDGLYSLSPWYVSLFEDHLTIQFNHRMLAYGLIVLAGVHAFRVARLDDDRVSASALLLAVLMVVQAGLGIWTLLSVDGAIPIGLGIMHQTLAAILFATSVWHFHNVNQMIQR